MIPAKDKWHLILRAILLISVLGFSCSGDVDYRSVAFSHEDSEIGKRSPSSSGLELSVAVAAMISPQETFSKYQALLHYLGKKIDRPIRLVQRKTYAEVNQMLKEGNLDVAFVCSGPYANARQVSGFEALVTPVVRGEPFYQAYLIVNKESGIETLEALEGKSFAFTDPDSNTGSLVPRFWLAQMGEQAESFFGKSAYTYSHDNSIMAVARSLVDGASVDGHVWEYFNVRSPVHTARTRVIRKSKPFGSPPIVAGQHLDSETKNRVRKALLAMHEDENGQRILDGLLIDRFVPTDLAWYRPIEELRVQVQTPEQLSK